MHQASISDRTCTSRRVAGESDPAASPRRDIPAWLLWSVLLAVACVISVCAILAFSPGYISNDGSQYLSTARNLLSGNGVFTDIVYFDPHYRFGTVPAPQTVWPPAFPLLIAVAAQVFGDPHYAAFLLNVAIQVGTGLLLCFFLRAHGCSNRLSLIVGVCYLLFADAWLHSFRIMSEPLLIFTSLLCVLLLSLASKSPTPRLLIFAAGLAAAFAFLARYAGVFLCFAVALWYVLRWARARSWAVVADAIAFFTMPVIIVGGIFLRNYIYTGSFTSRSGSDEGGSLLMLLELLRYQIPAGLMGFEAQGILKSPFHQVTFVLFALCIGAVLLAKLPSLVVGLKRALLQPGIQVALLYIVVTLAYLLQITLTSAPGELMDRYLMPLVAPLLLVLGVAIHQANVARVVRWQVGFLAAGFAILFVVQLNDAVVWLHKDHRAAQVLSALDSMTDQPDNVWGRIQSNRATAVLFSNEAQVLSAVANVKALGVPDWFLTDHVYDAERLRILGKNYDLALVAFFPQLFDEHDPRNSHRRIFIELADGRVPEWLIPVFENDSVRLFELDHQKL